VTEPTSLYEAFISFWKTKTYTYLRRYLITYVGWIKLKNGTKD